MWLLDTDHMTILERGGIMAQSLQIRLDQVPPSRLATTIVNYEEQMRGWLAQVAQAKTPQKLVIAYDFLQAHIETFNKTPILAYDKLASEEFERLRQAKIRIGTKDLRIAAICITYDATLLTRNLKDFGQVPGLKAEDWSV